MRLDREDWVIYRIDRISEEAIDVNELRREVNEAS